MGYASREETNNIKFFSKSLYHIHKLKDHSKNKVKILSKMSGINKLTPNLTEFDSVTGEERPTKEYTYISNTDWTIQMENPHIDWVEWGFSERDRERFCRSIHKRYKYNKFRITESWFNQYSKGSGSDHPFHGHPDISLTNVYFVELKDKSLGTILVDPKTKKEIRPRVNEGDVLTFPGTVIHKSPPNYTNNRKSVSAFNIRFLS